MSLKSPLPLQLRGCNLIQKANVLPVSSLYLEWIRFPRRWCLELCLLFLLWDCFFLYCYISFPSLLLCTLSAWKWRGPESGNWGTRDVQPQSWEMKWSVSGSSVLHVLKDENGFNVAGGSSSYSRAVWVITQGGCKCAHTQYPLDPCMPFPGPTVLQSGTGIWKCHGRNHQILSCQKVMSTWNEDFQ